MKTLTRIIALWGMMLTTCPQLLWSQCYDPTRYFAIDSVNKVTKKVYFTFKTDSATSAYLYYYYGSQYHNMTLTLVNGEVRNSFDYQGEPDVINVMISYYYNSNYCHTTKTVDLSCKGVSAYQYNTKKCAQDFQRKIQLNFFDSYDSSGDTVTILLANKNNSPIDTLQLSTDSLTTEYQFNHVGFDTLRVTYRKQFCERTEQVPILISGDCRNFSCDKDLQIEATGINNRKITINHPQASLYHWSLNSPYGEDTATTSANNRNFSLAANTPYSLWVAAIDPTQWCYADTSIKITTSSCYTQFSGWPSYGTTAYFSLSTLPTDTNTYVLSFGDGKDTTLNGPFSYTSLTYTYDTTGGKNNFIAVLKVINRNGETCNVITQAIAFKSCNTSFSSYMTGNDPLEKTFYIYANTFGPYDSIRFVIDFGDGQQYALTSEGVSAQVTHRYPQNGTYTVKLLSVSYVNDSIVCSDENTATVIVGSSPLTADFSYYEDNSTFKFFDNSVGVITNYQWDFGDGSTSTAQNPSHRYAADGTYQVCLTVKDDVGRVHTQCKEIVKGTPGCLTRANFIISRNPAQANKITFNNLSTGATKYYWDFGDGNVSTDESPTHTYSTIGIYTVKLSAYAEDCYSTYKQKITVGVLNCLARFERFVNSTSGEVTINNTSIADNNNAVYFWNFGDGSYSSSANPPAKTYTKDGKYTISLLVYDPNTGCYDYAEQDVYIDRTCKAQFSYYIDSAIHSIQLQNLSVNANKYFWTLGDGSISTDLNPTKNFSNAGIYKIALTIANTVTGCLDSHEEYITIGHSADCEADFVYRVAPSTNQVFFFDRSKGNITKYLWNFGNGTTSTQQNPTITYTKPGAYNVCLTVVSAGGISNITCKKIITSGNTCVANYDYVVEPGRKVYFNETSLGNPVNYQWNFGDNAQASGRKVDHTYAANGYYLTSLKISNGSTCNSSAYRLINVGMPGKIKAGIVVLSNSSSNKAGGYPVDFIGAGLGDDVRIKWTFGDGTEDTTTTSPTHVYSAPGTYTACYIVSDPITGQADTACTVVTVTDISHPIASSDNLQVYPVPFNDLINVTLSLKQATKVQISLYDLSGRNIVLSNHNVAGPGDVLMGLNTTHIKSGTYILRVDIGGQRLTRLVVKQ